MKRWMKNMCIMCCLIAAVAAFANDRARATADHLFGNRTYLSDDPYTDGQVTIVNGKYIWSHVTEDGFFLSYHLFYDEQYVYGDFNRDGLRDAAVMITDGEGGSGESRSLAFLINDGTKLVHTKSIGLGDRIVVNSLKARQGSVVLDMLVHGAHDCMAGPTKRVQRVYDYASAR